MVIRKNEIITGHSAEDYERGKGGFEDPQPVQILCPLPQAGIEWRRPVHLSALTAGAQARLLGVGSSHRKGRPVSSLCVSASGVFLEGWQDCMWSSHFADQRRTRNEPLAPSPLSEQGCGLLGVSKVTQLL